MADTYTPRERDLKRANFEMHIRALRLYIERNYGIYGMEALYAAQEKYHAGFRVNGAGDMVKSASPSK